ncbi:MAG: IS66 family transposase [Phycisphaeraceae bacterium]
MTLDKRARQLQRHSEARSCVTQHAYLRRIHRRLHLASVDHAAQQKNTHAPKHQTTVARKRDLTGQYMSGVDATNWRAEQALRPAVVNRKVWGGSRTQAGAEAQSILLTISQTARLRGIDTLRWLSQHLRSPDPPPNGGLLANG